MKYGLSLALAVCAAIPTTTGCTSAAVAADTIMQGRPLAEGRADPVALSTDGSRLAFGDAGGTVHLHDIDGRREKRFQVSGSLILAATFSPDGRWLAIGGTPEYQHGIPFTPDPPGKRGPPHDHKSEGVQKDQAKRRGDEKTVGKASPPFISSGRQDDRPVTGGMLRILDADTLAALATAPGLKFPVIAISVNKDKRHISIIDKSYSYIDFNESLRRAGLQFGRPGLASRLVTRFAPTTSFSSDMARVVSMDIAHEERHATLKLWDVKERKCLVYEPPRAVEPPSCAVMDPGGKLFLTAGGNGSVSLWDFEKVKPVRTYEVKTEGVDGCEFLAVSPDGLRIVAGYVSGRIRVWHANSGKVLTTARGPVGPVRAVAFRGDALRIASGGAFSGDRGMERLEIWDIPDVNKSD